MRHPILLYGGFVLTAFAVLAAVRAEDAAPATGRFDLTRPEIRSFVDGVSERDGLRRRDVVKLLSKAVAQPKIIEAMNRPAEKVTPWWQYRAHFLTQERIDEGARFWAEHREVLERIAAERGVAPEYIVAIVGVETFYGRMTGKYRVLDALCTLAFDYPPRSAFFRDELEQFLLLAKEDNVDPLATTGSYAGAMGAGQFMPSSYRRYAIDEDGDGRRDLWHNWDDVLASVANFLRSHGWEPGRPVLAEASLEPEASVVVAAHNLELDDTIDGLRAKGVEFEVSLSGTEPALLVPAEEADGPVYRVGFRNFYAITRYNHSLRYAMAVHDLATALVERMRAKPT